MIRSWTIGDIKVTSLVEYFGPTHVPETTFPGFDRARMARAEPLLPEGSWYPSIDRIAIAIRIWIVFAGSDIVLVDTGVGNAKPRPAARMNMLNTLVPAWLAAAGAPRERVTHVVMTHLHSDHVGWNTMLEGGRWMPTFPNARYILPADDLDYFRSLNDRGMAIDLSFADSVQPILDAGLAGFVRPGDELAGGLNAEAAFGHTPGMLNYRIESRGQSGLFTADVFHHPIQILEPDWNTAFCILPEQARATRHAVLAHAAAEGTLLMPCHFPPPHCGFVRRQGDGYLFDPAS